MYIYIYKSDTTNNCLCIYTNKTDHHDITEIPPGLISCHFVYVEGGCWLLIDIDDDRCILQMINLHVLLTDTETWESC